MGSRLWNLTAVPALWLALLLLAMVATTARSQTVINTFPYLETFDSASLCSDCSVANGDGECLAIGTELGWEQETTQDTADTNWVVWTGNAPTAGTGPKTGDHTSGMGRYLWIHQGTGRADSDDDDDGAPYCTPDPTNFYDQTVGIVSPVFDFSAVASDDNIFLRFWAWMFGLRVGTLTVELTTSGSVDGPWQSPPLLVTGLGDNRWTEHLLELVGMQGQPTVRLRFFAHFLNRSCPYSTCGSGDSTPPPEDMADQAIDDVEIVLSSSATAVSAGTEDRAIWVDLTSRDSLSGVIPFAQQHQAAWSDLSTALGDHKMVTWGGISATGEAIDQSRIFDYEARQYSQEQDTGTLPIPRRRGAFVGLGGPTASDGRLAIYGGRGKFGLTSSFLMLSLIDGSFVPLANGTLNCTDLDPTQNTHIEFSSEGAQAVLDPQDSGAFFLTFGRSQVVQVNFISRVAMDATSGVCSAALLLPNTTGAQPPSPRWNHVVGAWSNPSTGGSTYLFVFGGRFQPADHDPPRVLSDLQIFDVANQLWLDQLPTADPSQRPAGRSGATAATNMAGDKLVLFGGLDDTAVALGGSATVFSDVFVLQYDLVFQLWKRLAVGLDVATVPSRARHTMLPMFFLDTTLDPATTDPAQLSEGFLVYGGVTEGEAPSNHVAKLHFGTLSLTPVATDSGDDEDPTVAIVLGVLLPFCCLFLLLLVGLALVVGGLMAWRAVAKRRLKRKYGIGQEDLEMDDQMDQ